MTPSSLDIGMSDNERNVSLHFMPRLITKLPSFEHAEHLPASVVS